MKKILFVVICFFAISTTVNAQASIKLTFTDNCSEVENWFYKVTIIFYSGENCTGTPAYCYYISNNNVYFNNTQIQFSECHIDEGTSIKVFIEKFNADTGHPICNFYSECLSYTYNMNVALP